MAIRLTTNPIVATTNAGGGYRRRFAEAADRLPEDVAGDQEQHAAIDERTDRFHARITVGALASGGRRLRRTATNEIVNAITSVAMCAASDNSAKLLVSRPPSTSAIRKVAVRPSPTTRAF